MEARGGHNGYLGRKLGQPSSSQSKSSYGAWEDLGTSFAPSRDASRSSQPSSQGSSRPTGLRNNSKVVHNDMTDSDDEMDLLSDSTSAAGSSKKSRRTAQADDGVYDQGGTFHHYNPNYRPEKENTVKSLKFKKNKPNAELSKGGNAMDVSATPRASKKNNGKTPQTAQTPVFKTQKPKSSLPSRQPSSSQSKLSTNKIPSRSQSRRVIESSDSEDSDEVECEPVKQLATESKRVKPRPKPVTKTPQPFPLSSSSSPPPRTPKKSKAISSSKSFSKKTVPESPKRRQPDDLPMLREDQVPSSRTTVREVEDFPSLSPLRSSQSAKSPTQHPGAKDFPFMSPLRNQVASDPTLGESGALQGFPMSSQDFEPSSSPASGPSSSFGKKRLSDESDSRSSKRSKNDEPSLSITYDNYGISSRRTDHSDLCPYCDDPLPPHPTPVLESLLADVKKKSKPAPRPQNRLGRKAAMADFISVCHRHRFESEVMPEAEANGWPTIIKWHKVAKRVQKLKNVLQAIILDSDDSPFGEIDTDERPRSQCVFWQELQQQLKKQGSRFLGSVRGQFANFEKIQPGYYGEQGLLIISRKVEEMFPLTSIDADTISPLNPQDFVQRILVPEAAARLIIEDRKLSGSDAMNEAVRVLRASARYGVTMFPEDGGDDASADNDPHEQDSQMGVADIMLMQRARQRRQEIEVEEQEEEDERRLQGTTSTDVSPQSSQSNARPRPRSKRVKDQVSSDIEVSAVEATPRAKRAASRSRSRSVARSRSATPSRKTSQRAKLSSDVESDVAVLGVPHPQKARLKSRKTSKSSMTTSCHSDDDVEVVLDATPKASSNARTRSRSKAPKASKNEWSRSMRTQFTSSGSESDDYPWLFSSQEMSQKRS